MKIKSLILAASLLIAMTIFDSPQVEAGCRCQYRSKHVSHRKHDRRQSRHCQQTSTTTTYSGYTPAVQTVGDADNVFDCNGKRCFMRSRTRSVQSNSAPVPPPVIPPTPPVAPAVEKTGGNTPDAPKTEEPAPEKSSSRLSPLPTRIMAAGLQSGPSMIADAPERGALTYHLVSDPPQLASNN